MVLVSHLAQGTPCLGVSCLVGKGRGIGGGLSKSVKFVKNFDIDSQNSQSSLSKEDIEVLKKAEVIKAKLDMNNVKTQASITNWLTGGTCWPSQRSEFFFRISLLHLPGRGES